MNYSANNYHLRRMKFLRNPLPTDSPHHGTLYGYQGCFCRCDSCRKANTDHWRNYWRKRRQREKRNARDRARRATKKLLTTESGSTKV